MSKVLKSLGYTPIQTTEIPKLDTDAFQAYEQSTPEAQQPGANESVTPEELMKQARTEAQQLLERAEAEREAVLAAAQEEALRIREEAHETGYREGFAQGEETARTQGQARYDELIRMAQKIGDDNKRRWEEIVQSLHTVVSGIVARAVKTLVQRELETAPADIDAMVSQLLEYVVEGARVRVLVNPTDYEAAAHQFGQWLSDGYGEWPISVVPDQSLSEGSCVLETAHGQVDARMETRMELVQSTLAQVIERGLADELKR